MKKYNKIYYRIIFVTMCFVLSSVFMLISGAESLAKSKGIKLRYNGKTSINRSKQMSVTYQNKKVSKKSYPAVVNVRLHRTCCSVKVFKKGMKVSCKYKKKGKVLTLSANGISLKMQVGKKTAYKNGKKVKLKAAPVSLRFISNK